MNSTVYFSYKSSRLYEAERAKSAEL